MVEEVSPEYFKTGEQAEGAKAFLEKRKPNLQKIQVNENKIYQSYNFEYAF